MDFNTLIENIRNTIVEHFKGERFLPKAMLYAAKAIYEAEQGKEVEFNEFLNRMKE